MSVSRTGDSKLSYSDHDVHWVRHGFEFESGSDAGPTVIDSDTRRFEITSRGLDPDELAELKMMRVNLYLRPGDDVINQDEIGGLSAIFQTGYNLAGDEFLTTSASTEFIDSDGSGTNDFTARFRDTDEVGQLTCDGMACYAGYSDTTDGTGGAGGLPSTTYTIDFGMLGGGPVVDSADDFVSNIFLDVENMVGGIRAEAAFGLYYQVEETESGRTRFGR